MHWDYEAILIFLGVVLPLVGKWRVEGILRGAATTQADRLRLYASTIAFQWSLTAVILWRTNARGMNIAALGLAAPFPVRTAIVSLGLMGLLLANQLLSLSQLSARPDQLRGKLAQVALRIFPQDRIERLVFLGVVATVAICEELIFRGFVQGLFQGLFSNAAAGILISAGVFGLAHLYQGRRGVIATCIVGLLFACARYGTGSLLPCVAGHFVVDLVAGYMFPGRLRAAMALTGEAARVSVCLQNGDS
jgi:membrane protease YdiL (CAAX protease family)